MSITAATSFHHESVGIRVVFGFGAVESLADEVDRIGAKRVMIVCSPARAAQAQQIAGPIKGRLAGTYSGAVLHVPLDRVLAARSQAKVSEADALVSLGGGSAIDLAKGVALESDLPIIAIPSTYSGAETTASYGIMEEGVKKTGRDSKLFARCIIYDPALTVGVPASVSVTSGMNAVAHAVEALYGSAQNPLTSLMAEEAIRALAQALPAIARNPGDRDARASALYGAWLAGTSVSLAGMALHHRLCHVLGGTFGLPHAETHTALLPHVAALNFNAAPEAMNRAVRALKSDDAAGCLFDIPKSLGAEMALQRLGLREADIDRAAALAVQATTYNPSLLTESGVRALLKRAHEGSRPQA